MSNAKKRKSKKALSADSQRRSADSVYVARGRLSSLRLYILISLLVGVLAIGWFTSAPSRWLSSLAQNSLKRYDIDAAESWLNLADRRLPDHAERELLHARVARKNSNYEAMLKHLSRAKALGGDAKRIQIEEALGAAQSGALELVEPQLFQWIQAGVGDIDEISDAYANGLAAKSQFAKLTEVLEAWQRDFPNDPRPDYRRGRMREYFQEWGKAAEFYRSSLARYPTYYPSRYRLGRVLMLERKLDEAIAQFEECLSMRRPEAAKTSLAICYRTNAQAEKAKVLLEQVMAAGLQAIEKSYQSLDESPEYFEAASTLGDLESEGGNYAAAEKWLRMAVDENGRDLTSRYSLAVTLREQGRLEEAQREFDFVAASRKALEQVNPLRNQIAENPTDPKPRLELGELMIKHESERNGKFWIQSIFAIDPNYKPAHEALARYYREQSRVDSNWKALADYHENAANQSTP